MPSMESSDASRLRRGGVPWYISLNQVILNLVLAIPEPWNRRPSCAAPAAPGRADPGTKARENLEPRRASEGGEEEDTEGEAGPTPPQATLH